jgi:AraC-like DNA-binding protein
MLLKHEAFRRLCQARDLLAELDDEPLAVDAVARAVAISPFHFIRQFEAVFGVTPHQYRIRCRLDEAKRLLAAGHHSVTQVCMAVGFSSLGSFSELFKRRVGAPPSHYQRRLRVLSPVPERLQRVIAPGCLSLLGQLPPAAFRSFREA